MRYVGILHLIFLFGTLSLILNVGKFTVMKFADKYYENEKLN